MKELTLAEIKKVELCIIDYIDKVCRENNLRYFLCGGSLLGAIRHKGFIPWDDDIDIAMPRPDYEKFCALARDEKKYLALTPAVKGYYYNFTKVIDSETKLVELGCRPIRDLGIFIDVFPLEGMPSDKVEQEKHFKKLHRTRQAINSYAFVPPKLRKNIFAYVKRLYRVLKNKKRNLFKLQEKYVKLAKKYDYESSDDVYMSGGAYGKVEMFPKDYVSEYIDVEFEGRKFKGLKNYDKYLTKLYGNYMKLPPKEKQITHHNFIAVRKNTN